MQKKSTKNRQYYRKSSFGHFDTRLDAEYETPVPSLRSLVAAANVSLARCPGVETHFTMFEKPPPRPESSSNCLVNPFVHHGYYAKYLRAWLVVFPADRFAVCVESHRWFWGTPKNSSEFPTAVKSNSFPALPWERPV